MKPTLADIEAKRAALNITVETLCRAAKVNASTYYKNVAGTGIKTADRTITKLADALAEFELALGAPTLGWKLDDLVPRRLAWLDFVVLTPALEFNAAFKSRLIKAINEQCAAAGGSPLWISRVDVTWEVTRWLVLPWFWIDRTPALEPLGDDALDHIEPAAQSLVAWQSDMRACPRQQIVELMLFSTFGTRILGFRSDKLGFCSTETMKPVEPIAWRPAAEFISSINSQFYFGGALPGAYPVAAE